MLNTNKFKNYIFDFDGVILDSVEFKNQAFKKTVNRYDKKIVKKFMNFHLNNLGLSRFRKYKFLCQELLKLENTDNLEKKLSNNYSKIVNKKILKVKFINGVKNFILKNKEKKLFISSGSPQKELRKICVKKKISKYFIKVLGSPKTKYQHMIYLKKNYKIKNKETAFFGDSITDYRTAKKYNFTFIQVGNNMKNKKIKFRIKDFHDKKLLKL